MLVVRRCELKTIPEYTNTHTHTFVKFSCDPSKSKSTLLEEQCTFSAASRVPLGRFSWKISTREANWLRSVNNYGYFTWRTMYPLGCIPASTGGIFMKIHTCHSKLIRYKQDKFGCDRSIIQYSHASLSVRNRNVRRTKQKSVNTTAAHLIFIRRHWVQNSDEVMAITESLWSWLKKKKKKKKGRREEEERVDEKQSLKTKQRLSYSC